MQGRARQGTARQCNRALADGRATPQAAGQGGNGRASRGRAPRCRRRSGRTQGAHGARIVAALRRFARVRLVGRALLREAPWPRRGQYVGPERRTGVASTRLPAAGSLASMEAVPLCPRKLASRSVSASGRLSKRPLRAARSWTRQAPGTKLHRRRVAQAPVVTRLRTSVQIGASYSSNAGAYPGGDFEEPLPEIGLKRPQKWSTFAKDLEKPEDSDQWCVGHLGAALGCCLGSLK
eukprot:scaffold7242_cov400-Prasinococcus_capsulatus_cf.AAC.8